MDKKETDIGNFSRGAPVHGPKPKGIKTSAHQVIFADIGMHIDKNGIWHYRGSPINRLKLIKLFASILRRDKAGSYWLVTPTEIAPVEVVDAPLTIVGFQVKGTHHDQTIKFVTNVGTSATADKNHPLRIDINAETGEPSPYVILDHSIEARVNRPTYYDLVKLAVEEKVGEEKIFGVWSGGIFHKLCNMVAFDEHGMDKN